MTYNLIITIILISSFFLCLKAYYTGLKHGKQLSAKNIPNININPLKSITNAIDTTTNPNPTKQQQEELLTDIFNYNADTALEAIKRQNLNKKRGE